MRRAFRWRLSLRLQYLLILLAAGLPPLAFVTYEVFAEREAAYIRAGEEARLLAAQAGDAHRAVQARGRDLLADLLRLAKVSRLEPGECAEALAGMLQAFPQFVTIVVRDGADLVRCSARSSGPHDGPARIAVSTAVNLFVEGTANASIGSAEADLATEGLADLVDLPEGAVIAWLNGSGRVIRSYPQARESSLLLPSGLLSVTRAASIGIAPPRWEAAGGAFGLTRLAAEEAALLVAIPRPAWLQRAELRFRLRLAVMVGGSVVLLLIAWLLISRLTIRWIALASGALFATSSGEFARPIPQPKIRSELALLMRMVAFNRHRSAMRQGSLVREVRRRDGLLHGIDRRVSQDLRLVDRLLAMAGTDASFRLARSRLQATQIVYELASASPPSVGIDLSELMRALCDGLVELYHVDGSRVGWAIDIPRSRVAKAAATSLSLIVSEAVVGALHEAFPEPRHGTISIKASYEDDVFRLIVANNGADRPIGDPNGDRSLAAKVMQALAGRIDGHLDVDIETAVVILTVPVSALVDVA